MSDLVRHIIIMSNIKKDKMSIRIEPNLRKKLQNLADKEERTLSDFIRLHLKKIADEKSNAKPDAKGI